MPIYNNAVYDAVQQTALTYTLTIQSGREAIPADSKGIVLVLKDDDDKYARVKMDASGSTYTVTEIYSTTEADNTIPSWGTGLICFSSDVAEVLNVPLLSFGMVYSGQSNGRGKNEGKPNLDRLLFNEFDNRIKQSNFLQSPRDPDEIKLYAVEPIFHITLHTDPDSLGPAIPFAYKLLDEGWREINIFPMCENATTISQFAQGTTNYNYIRDSIVEYLNASPLNILGVWVHQQGETDNINGLPSASWTTAHVDLVDNMRTDVQALAGVDISRVPHLAVGLHTDFINSPNAMGNDINPGIEDVENNLGYSAYVPLGAGLSRNSDSANENGSTDEVHISASGMLEVARQLIDKLPAARLNFGAAASPIVVVNPALETDSSNVIVPVITGATIVPVGAAVEVDFSNTVSVPSAIAVGTATETDTSVAMTVVNSAHPLTDATNPTAYFRRDNGLNDTAGNYDSWDDLTGNGNNLGAATFGTPTVDAEGVVFAGADVIPLPDAFFTDPNGSTCILRYKATAGTLLINHLNSFVNPDVGSVGWQQGTNLVTSITGMNDGTWKNLAITLDSGELNVYINGVNVGTDNTITIATSSDGDGALGGRRTGANYMTGTASALYWKLGDALSLSDINDITSEFPT